MILALLLMLIHKSQLATRPLHFHAFKKFITLHVNYFFTKNSFLYLPNYLLITNLQSLIPN